MKSKYSANSDFLSAFLSSRPSYALRSILHDPWIRDGQMRRPLIKNPIIDIDLRVSDLIDYERTDRIKYKLEDLFHPDDVKCILKSKR
ncbi:unnamed protein product [Brassica oleracea]